MLKKYPRIGRFSKVLGCMILTHKANVFSHSRNELLLEFKNWKLSFHKTLENSTMT